MSKKVRRLDLGDLQPAVKRGDGTIRVQGHLTKCGVFTYVKPDGGISRELRTQEEVHSPASLNSFSGIPVTNDHPPEMINADNAKQYTVGSLQGTPFADDDHVRGDLAIYDSATINAIRRGKKQISLGYTCDLDETPGEHPVYGKYDAKQVNIRGNHCAIVSTARAGSTARVRLDAAQLIIDKGERVDHWMESRVDGGPGSGPRPSGASPANPGNAAITAAKAKEEAGAKKPAQPGRVYPKTAAQLAEEEANKPRAPRGNSGKDAEIDLSDPKRKAALAAFMNAKHVTESQSDFGEGRDPMVDHDLTGKKTGFWNGDPVDSFGALAKKDAIGTGLASSKNHAKLIEMAKALSEAADEELNKHLDVAAPDADDDMEDRGEEGDDEDDAPDSYEEDENMDAADPVPPQLAAPAPAAPVAQDADPAPAADPDSDQRIAAHTFAVPARKEMPIHSPAAVQTAMTGFGDHKFKGPDEKHAAFNRVYSKAIQFGVPRDARHAFQDTHGAKLDHADDLSPKEKMIELKKAKEALAAAVKRADAADQKVAKLEGQVESLKKDVDATKTRNDEADVENQKRMDAKLDLLVLARATGATVESTMTNRQIHSAVIKHVDKVDVADEKHDAYVEALFDGAVTRAKTDAVETLVGKNAIAIVRAQAEGARLDTLDADKNDAEDFSEAAAARRLKARTESAWIPTVKEKN